MTARSADEWETAVSRSFVPLRVNRITHAFEVSVARRRIGPATAISRVTSGSSALERTPVAARSDGVPSVLFVSHRAGSARVTQADRQSAQHSGQSVLYVTHRPYELSFPSAIDELVFQIPIADIGLSEARVERMAARTFEPTAPFRVMQSFLAELAACEPSAADPQLARVGGELLSVALGSLTDDPAPRTAEAALVAMKQFIRTNAADRALDPAAVAAAFHVSRRQLYNMFQTAGETPAEAIRRARVDRAATLLRAEPDRPVAQIAYEAGFEDQSTFARAFAAALGMSASEWRRAV